MALRALHRSLGRGITLAAAALLMGVFPAAAGPSATVPSALKPAAPSDGGGAGPRDMSTRRTTMREQWQQQDAKLDDLVAKMNGATGAAKVDAMAAVLTELVAQREAQHEMLSRRHPAADRRGGTQPADTGMSPGASCPMAGSHGAATVAGAGASPSTEAAARNADGAAG